MLLLAITNLLHVYAGRWSKISFSMPRSVNILIKKIPSLPGANRAYELGTQTRITPRFGEHACRERIVGHVPLLYS